MIMPLLRQNRRSVKTEMLKEVVEKFIQFTLRLKKHTAPRV
jgi:hypothetical protein